MSDSPTKEELRKSIEPRSDQINADDLLTGPITVTITKVRRGDREQPIIVEIEGRRPFKPCKTMRRVLIAVFGDQPSAWIGKRMTLFTDPDVKYAGVKVGGIRISHLSLDEPKTFLITQTRGKKSEVTIYPVPSLSDADRVYAEDAISEIAAAETMEALKAIGFILKKKSSLVQDELRPVYAQRSKELKDTSRGNS